MTNLKMLMFASLFTVASLFGGCGSVTPFEDDAGMTSFDAANAGQVGTKADAGSAGSPSVGGAGGLSGGNGSGGGGGSIAGTGGAKVMSPSDAEPSCQGKYDYDPCASTKYLETNGTILVRGDGSINEKSISLKGSCYKGVCCSGCVRNGTCVQVFHVDGHYIAPPGTPNECGTNAASCVDCNAHETMRACTNGVARPAGMSEYIAGDQGCID